MTSTTTPLDYKAYDHVHWYVGNAKQAAAFYKTRFNFHQVAYKGLETGCRVTASHVLRNGSVTFILTSPLRSLSPAQLEHLTPDEQDILRDVHGHLQRHGDAVKDVAFEVDDVEAVFGAAVKNGAGVVSEPRVLRDESEEGEVKVATVKTYGDTVHTLVERRSYEGVFLPGFREVNSAEGVDPISRALPDVQLIKIDHCVGNQDWDQMERVCE